MTSEEGRMGITIIYDLLETETGETIYKRRGHSTGTDDKNISKGERQ